MNNFKVLLAQPIWNIKDQFGRYCKGAGNNTFSYGLACIAAVAEQEGFDIQVCDTQVLDFSTYDFERYLEKGRFKIIGLPCYTASVANVRETASICKRILPDSVVVAGGIHPTLMPERTLSELKDVDIAVIGEGEYTFLDILRHFTRESPAIDQISGIAYRKDGQIKVNSRRPNISNLDDLPMPAYHLFPMKKYRAQFTIVKKLPTFGILASRGCPFECAFCNANAVQGKRLRCKSVARVIKEIRLLQDEYGANGITFQDSTFTVNEGWVREFCQTVIREKIKAYFMCYSRADTVNYDLLKLMKSAGFWGISFGLESANQKSLDLLKKGIRVDQSIEAVRMAQKLKYYVQASFILALPGEDKKDSYNTISFAKKLGTEIALFNWPTPYPKTELAEICAQTGGLQKDIKWEDYNFLTAKKPIYLNPDFSEKERRDILNYAVYSYYLHPRILLNNLKHISSIDDMKKCYHGFLGVFGKKW